MRWKTKATLQNAVSLLPSRASYAVYYWMQKRFGGLRDADPVTRLVAATQTWGQIRNQRIDPTDKVFFEVGTGAAPVVPLAYWLMGARCTITVDVNPYVRAEVVRAAIDYIAANTDEIRALFGSLLHPERLEALLPFRTLGAFSLDRFFDLCSIRYIAPGNAARTGLPDDSVDLYTSYTVLEHIPPEVLADILIEGNRIVRRDGIFVHRIDYSDHFAHSDKTISPINFLHYSDRQWSRFAGNRYMYMNRLRHDDVLDLFRAAHHRILATATSSDTRLAESVTTGRLRLDDRFKNKSPEVLATLGAWIVSQTADPSTPRDDRSLHLADGAPGLLSQPT